MDITLIKTFIEVANTGSFVAACDRLFVTQSAISLRIQRLEDSLGHPLFTRSKAGAILTPDLLSAMQEKEPGPDEPWPVMIMLDEFNRLGKMPIVVESIETLRTYRGHLALVTQTIPALDEIYGENTRRALQGNAGVKLYLTPSDEKTIEELSKAVGKTTKTVITRSRSIGKNPFEGRSQSTRTEETSLLPEDEARRLPLDEIIMVVDAQMPVRAKRIQYFDDRLFAAIHGAQTGELPFPQLGRGGGGVSGSESGGSRQNLKQDGIGAQLHRPSERSSGPQ